MPGLRTEAGGVEEVSALTAFYCAIYAQMHSDQSPESKFPSCTLVSFGKKIRERMTVITLDEEDYYSAIASAVAQRVAGGTIYDALLAKCALKANAPTIYTWDLDRFRLLGPEVARRVRTP